MSDNTFDNNFSNPNATVRPIYVSTPKSYALSGKIMVSAIVVIFAVVVLMIALHMYARWYLHRVHRLRRRHHRTRRQRASNIVFYVDQSSAAGRNNRGLEASVRDSLPLFVYTELTHKDDLDCAVCLSEFEEGETGRVLPNCQHSFHVECIDMWFHSHSTCPTCRAKVEPVDPTRNKDVLVTVGKPVQLEPEPVQPSGSRSVSLAERRNGLDLASVKIEVPSRTELVDEPRPSSPASYGFMSPGNRLQSLKRILSMKKRPAPSVETGTSSPSGTELDVELGISEESCSVRTPMPK